MHEGDGSKIRLLRDDDVPAAFELSSEAGWNQTEASERFLIPLSTLNQKIKRLGIDVRRRARSEESFIASSGK